MDNRPHQLSILWGFNYKILDTFLHPKLRSGELEITRKSRLLVGFTLGLLSLSFVGVLKLSTPWFHPYSLCILFGLFAHCVNLFLIRTFGAYKLSSTILIMLMFLGTSVMIYNTGGILSPGLYWTASIPLVSVLLLGVRMGSVFILLPILENLMFFFVFPKGQLLMGFRTGTIDILLSQIMFVLLLVLLGWLSETSRIKALFGMRESILNSHELTRQRDAAKLANIAKSEFLATMSHELRTPLNAIIGYAEMLEEDLGDVEEEYAQDANKIRSAGKHLLTLINDLLDISEIEAGKTKLVPERFALDELIEELNILMPPLLKPNENTLNIKIANSSVCLFGDRRKIRQCLLNLLSNACKFTHKGTITLSASIEQSPQEGAPFVDFHVQDTGIGMAEEQMSKLFEKFEQGDGSVTRKYGGTGLGLAITKNFALLMGGDVWCQSTKGEGSTFTLRLPLHYRASEEDQTILTPTKERPTETAPSTEITPHQQAQSTNSSSTILVVDDDPAFLDLMTRLLTQEGFRVITTSSGAEGINIVRALQPLAMILDVNMPEVDGWHVLNALKETPENVDTPILMVSIHEEYQKSEQNGASGFMAKPIQREQLLKTIRTHTHQVQNTTPAI